MSKLKEKVELREGEVAVLRSLVGKGKHPIRKVKRAQVLLRLDKGEKAFVIAQAVGVSVATVYHIHDRYLAGLPLWTKSLVRVILVK